MKKQFYLVPLTLGFTTIPMVVYTSCHNVNYNECLVTTNVDVDINDGWNKNKEVFAKYELTKDCDVLGVFSVTNIKYDSGPIPADCFAFYYVQKTIDNKLEFCLHQADEAAGWWFRSGAKFTFTCLLNYENHNSSWSKPLKITITQS